MMAGAIFLASCSQPVDTAGAAPGTTATPAAANTNTGQDDEAQPTTETSQPQDSAESSDTSANEQDDTTASTAGTTTTVGEADDSDQGGFIVPGLDACGGGTGGPVAPDIMPGVVIVDSPETAGAGASVLCADGSSPVFLVIDEWLIGLGAEIIARIDDAVVYQVSRDALAPTDPIPPDVVAAIVATAPGMFDGNTMISVTDDIPVFNAADWFVEQLVTEPGLVTTVDPALIDTTLVEVSQNDQFFAQFDASLLEQFSQQLDQLNPLLLQRIDVPQLEDAVAP
jgi:hypothetical protein